MRSVPEAFDQAEDSYIRLLNVREPLWRRLLGRPTAHFMLAYLELEPRLARLNALVEKGVVELSREQYHLSLRFDALAKTARRRYPVLRGQGLEAAVKEISDYIDDQGISHGRDPDDVRAALVVALMLGLVELKK